MKKYTILIIAVLLISVLVFAVACDTHEHSYTWELTTSPTCEGAGVETGTCECGNKTTRPVEATGHDWGAYEVTEQPTETATGVVTATCKTDAEHKHNASLPVLTDEAYTKTPDGKGFYVEYKITLNDEVTGEAGCEVKFDVYVHEHTIDWEVVEEATCLAAGKKVGTCSHELCEDTFEEEIPQIEHKWSEPAIVVAPTSASEGSAVVTCEHDKDGNHQREYVLPALNTSWENHSVEGDAKECIYNGYVGSADAEDSSVFNFVMSIYDPFQGYECGPQTYEIAVPFSTTNCTHVYGDYVLVTEPTGNGGGRATATCLVNPEHTKDIYLPSFNNNRPANQNYTFEVDGEVVKWSITVNGVAFQGEYVLPASISIKTAKYPTADISEPYNDGDTIQLNVGDKPYQIFILTPLGGYNASTVTLSCVDENGDVVKISTDFMFSSAYQDKGLTLDSTSFGSGDSYYFKDYCPVVHYLTIETEGGLSSTFKIDPVLDAPSSSSPLRGLVYNKGQGAWNNLSDSPEVYLGAEITLGAVGSLYTDPTCSVGVVDANGEDVTDDCIVAVEAIGKRQGFVFCSISEGVYKVTLTSTRNTSYKISFDVVVKGLPKPSQLFGTSFYYANDTYKFTLEEVNNDDEQGTSFGNGTLTVESEGLSLPFSYTYGNGVSTFLAPQGCDYAIELNNNFEIALTYYDEFDETETTVVLDRLEYFVNSVVGTYHFEYNPDYSSPSMTLVLNVNQSGTYKFSINKNYVCVRINDSTEPAGFNDCDYRVGAFLGSGSKEQTITLNEGDVVYIFNTWGQMPSDLTITLVEE